MNNEQFEQDLIELIESGRAMAILEDGELKFYHIEHTDNEMLKNALPLKDVKRLLKSGEAE